MMRTETQQLYPKATAHAELRCLDSSCSTTRLVTDSPPKINDDPSNKLPSMLRLPDGNERQGEGGLRTRGFYKKSSADKPLVTVITVVFNGVATIEDTIRSVLNQGYDNVEYIVIDGGSNDGTLDIIKKYEHAIDYWVSEKDAGIYDAMNKGISLSSGMYVGLLNSDDLFASTEVLRSVVAKLRASDSDAVFSCLNIVDRLDLNKVVRRYRVANFSLWLLRIGIMPPHPTFYCKRVIYEKVGRYKIDYRVAADYEMMVRMFASERIIWAFLDEVTVKMRSGGISNNGIVGQIRHNFEIVRACRENGFYTNMALLLLKLPIRLRQLFA